MSYDIIPSDRDELIYELKRLKSEYELTIPYFKDISKQQKEIDRLKDELTPKVKPNGEGEPHYPTAFTGCGCFIYLLLGPAISFGILLPKWFIDLVNYFGYWKFGIGLLVSIFILITIVSAKSEKKKENQIKMLEEDIQSKIEKVKNIIHHIPSDFLPDDYKSYLAVEGMLNRVEAHRADTFKEALNLYTAESIHLKKIFGLDGLTKEYICQQWIVIQAHEPNKYGEEAKEKLY